MRDPSFHNVTNSSSRGFMGTSFHDVTINVSYETLVKLFGEPWGPSGDNKVKHEWRFSGSFSATLYDYKYAAARNGHWHIGTRDRLGSLMFCKWLVKQLMTVKLNDEFGKVES